MRQKTAKPSEQAEGATETAAPGKKAQRRSSEERPDAAALEAAMIAVKERLLERRHGDASAATSTEDAQTTESLERLIDLVPQLDLLPSSFKKMTRAIVRTHAALTKFIEEVPESRLAWVSLDPPVEHAVGQAQALLTTLDAEIASVARTKALMRELRANTDRDGRRRSKVRLRGGKHEGVAVSYMNWILNVPPGPGRPAGRVRFAHYCEDFGLTATDAAVLASIEFERRAHAKSRPSSANEAYFRSRDDSVKAWQKVFEAIRVEEPTTSPPRATKNMKVATSTNSRKGGNKPRR